MLLRFEKMVVKVYGSAKAGCAQRVLACLLEKEIDFEIIHVDLEIGEQKQPGFLARQPFGQVPAIEDGEFKLFESRAIMRYYASKYVDRGTNLLGTTLEERALVDQWFEVEAHTFNDLVYTLMIQLVALPRKGQVGDLALIKISEEKLGKVFDVYDKRLSQSKYLGGDFFSLADLSHLPGIQLIMNEIGVGHLVTSRKNLNAWWEDISNRPSWKQIMEVAE